MLWDATFSGAKRVNSLGSAWRRPREFDKQAKQSAFVASLPRLAQGDKEETNGTG